MCVCACVTTLLFVTPDCVEKKRTGQVTVLQSDGWVVAKSGGEF